MNPPSLQLIAATAVLSLTLTACGTSAQGAPSSLTPNSLAGAKITVYNAQHEELTQEWADEFQAKTGVRVTLRNGEDAELANQIVQEGNASPADVFLTENSPAMSLVDNAGLFTDVDADTLAQVPAAYRPSTGKWTGIAARSTVLVYNPSLIKEVDLPASLLDLSDAAWKGRWAASPGGADFQAIVSALLHLKGKAATEKWLAGMKENFTPFQGNGAVMRAVNAGQIPVGVIYHYYWFIDQAGTKENSTNAKVHFFGKQDPGAFVSVSGGGVLAASKNQAAAQAFLAFVTSKDGQDVLRTGTSMEYTVASGVPANPALPSLDTLDAPGVDPATLNGAEVISLMTAAGLL
jgi:iron(III) transport system substrate-binding protein